MRHHPSWVENEAEGREDRREPAPQPAGLCRQDLSITQNVSRRQGHNRPKGQQVKGREGFTG